MVFVCKLSKEAKIVVVNKRQQPQKTAFENDVQRTASVLFYIFQKSL